jgi:hypothetical protein
LHLERELAGFELGEVSKPGGANVGIWLLVFTVLGGLRWYVVSQKRTESVGFTRPERIQFAVSVSRAHMHL